MTRTFLALLLATVSSFSFAQANTLMNYKWLEGVWQQKGTDRFEKWTFASDTIANGLAYILSDDGEAVPDEILQLIATGGKVYYMPLVKNQNGGRVVQFLIVKSNEQMFVAENPQHDFPQRIVYKRKSATEMMAYIETLQKKKRSVFYFTKVQ